MADPRSVIERGLARAGSDSYTLESFYRRRDRKRARKRLTAGIVGLAIAIGMVVVGSAILRSAPEDKDVGREGLRILREDEVLQVEDPFGPAATLVATDPATGHQRVLHGCAGDCGWIQEFNLSTDRRWIAWRVVRLRRMRHDRGWWTVGGRRGRNHDPRDLVGSSTGLTWWLVLGVVTCC